MNNLGLFIGVVAGALVLAVAVIIYFAFFHKKVVANIAAKKQQMEQVKAQKQAQQQMQDNYAGNLFGQREVDQKRKDYKDPNQEQSVMNIVGKKEATVVDKSLFKHTGPKEDQMKDSNVQSVMGLSRNSNLVTQYDAKKQKKEETVTNAATTTNESSLFGVLNKNEFNQKIDKKVFAKKNDDDGSSPESNAEEVIGLMNNTSLNRQVTAKQQNNETTKPESDASEVEKLMKNSQFRSPNNN